MTEPAKTSSPRTGRWARKLSGLRILFMVNRREGTSARWRILPLLQGLRDHGAICTVDEIPEGAFARLAQTKRAEGQDVVILQNRLLPKLVLQRLRSNSKRLIFDFDEPGGFKRTPSGVVASLTRERRFQRTLRAADVIIAATSRLSTQAQRLLPESNAIHTIPTGVDFRRWPRRPQASERTSLVLGWFGSTASFSNLDVIRPVLTRLCRYTEHVVIRTVGLRPIELPGLRVEHRLFKPDTEVSETCDFDIALSPIVEHPWTRGRVQTSLLAPMAAGVPVISSDTADARTLIRDGENGFLCGTLRQWEERLAELVEDAELRARIGAAGRATVEQEASVEAMVRAYSELLAGS